MKLISFMPAFGALAAMAVASQALAQTPAPPQPAPPTVNIPGVCVLSREALVGSSTVGKFISTRMGQLSGQVQAELGGEQSGLQAEAKTLDGQKATLQPSQFQQQAQSLQQREAALQQKAQQRDHELQATEQKAIAHVLQEASPLVSGVVQQRQCGLVLDGNAVLLGNPAMDITQPVIDQLNAKITQFAFDREHLDGQAGAPR
jgi:Skp family chaperone for outer membrane proteins